MERIGIYGGSFNPPHIGHVQAAAFAIDALQLDRLLVMPAGTAPHKELPPYSASPDQRLEMLRYCFRNEEKIVVSDLEVRREGMSYTYETVEALQQRYPDSQLVLIMGTDMFLSLESWVNYQRIVACVSLGVLYRGDADEQAQIMRCKQLWQDRGVEVQLVCNPVVPISSTQLRRLIAFHCAGEFLPEGLSDVIAAHNLYGAAENWKQLPMDRLEQVVISLLNPNRVAHVLGCRDTAEKMAARWGADPVAAARAGLLHDITKALDGPLQLTLCREYGTILDEFGQRHPKTLHALTGSLVADRIFGESPEVVSAIRHHTTGKANMTVLEKIIYVADYMEPCRSFPGVEKLRQLAFSDLDGALRLGLEMTLENLRERGLEVSPESREALAFLNL